MPKSFTTQGNDFLPTTAHHTQTSTSTHDETTDSSTSSVTAPQFIPAQNTQAFSFGNSGPVGDSAPSSPAGTDSGSDTDCNEPNAPSDKNTNSSSGNGSGNGAISKSTSLTANDACVTTTTTAPSAAAAPAPAAVAAALPTCISRTAARIIDIKSAASAASTIAPAASALAHSSSLTSLSPQLSPFPSDLRYRGSVASSASWTDISTSAASASTSARSHAETTANAVAGVHRGTKRRGSDSSIVLMAVGTISATDDASTLSAFSKNIYRKKRSTTSSDCKAPPPPPPPSSSSSSSSSLSASPSLVMVTRSTKPSARGSVNGSGNLRTRDSRNLECLLKSKSNNSASVSAGSRNASSTTSNDASSDRVLSFSTIMQAATTAPCATASAQAAAPTSAVSTADGCFPGPHHATAPEPANTAATPNINASTTVGAATQPTPPNHAAAPQTSSACAAASIPKHRSAPDTTTATTTATASHILPPTANNTATATATVSQQHSVSMQSTSAAVSASSRHLYHHQQLQQQQQQQHTCALPPINRYTLRELKIQNILQNPRLRHEVLFEPKLEFRPNSSGHLAEAKQRAAMQYWAAIEHGLQGWLSDSSPLHNRNNERQQCVAPGMSAVPVLIVELREILAEMAEDSPKHELVQYAQELRERLDEDVIRQQIQHNVFDPVPVVTYMASVMRQFAQCERYAAVDRLVAYVRRGRFVRALRSAFDVLEAIKIDIANSSIEMYREYMRSTAVAFERSHFNMDLRRNNIALEDTAEWWQRALASGKRYHISLDDIFYEASRELILDDGQNVPGLFRMDEARIHLIRRELERMSIVGVVFLAFAQFLQLASRNKAPQPLSSTATAIDRSEFKSASGRVDFQRLAGECMLLVPEGCSVQWSEPLIAASASPMPLPAVSAAAAATAQLPPFADKASSSVTPARGSEISFSRLVGQLVSLAERTLGRAVGPNEVAILERTLLRSARYECPLREIVEDRVNSTIRTHTQALASLNGKLKGNEWEEMPASAKDLLRRSMLGFLAPGLATLAVKIHSVTTHHWHVYKAYYASLSSSSSPSSSSSSSSTSCPSHADNSDSSSSSSLQAVQ